MTDETETAVPIEEPVAVAAPEVSAAERLAALEEKLFGGRAARLDGKIERGHGSLFRRLPEDEQRRYLALEAEVAAEAELALARAALSAAEKKLKDAEAKVAALQEK